MSGFDDLAQEEKDDKKRSEFHDKLVALQNEYGFVVASCGCCDSPWILPKEKAFHYIGDGNGSDDE